MAAEIKRKLEKKEKKKKKRQKKLEALSTAEGDEETNGDVEVHRVTIFKPQVFINWCSGD